MRQRSYQLIPQRSLLPTNPSVAPWRFVFRAPFGACDWPSPAQCPSTVAILAQGTHWAVAISQAFFYSHAYQTKRTSINRNRGTRALRSGNRTFRWRPYRVECTGSLLTSEVKRHRARLVSTRVGDRLGTPRGAASFFFLFSGERQDKRSKFRNPKP